MDLKKSRQAFADSKKYIPGGVNSPVRAFKNVGGSPLFISHGKGAKIYDIDGNEYLDFCLSWGALILGHADPDVTAVLQKSIKKSTSYGCPTLYETELARMICSAIPSIEKVRFVNSGTEALMSAIRLARAYTSRDALVKFDGCYHGHSDALLVNAGSGAAEMPEASSRGIPQDVISATASLPFNDIKIVKEYLEKNHKRVAAVIVEPVPANMGLVLPNEGFLHQLREVTSRYGIVLIFDEVITGFRLCYGGAQDFFGIQPDITCLGKIIGGGFPVGAFGGRKDIMDLLAPEGNVYQAGTLSGNPVAMNAGISVLKRLNENGFYENMKKRRQLLEKGLANIPGVRFHSLGSMFCLLFSDNEIHTFQNMKSCNQEKYKTYFWRMLEKGIYTVPSQFETNFFSTAHSLDDIEQFTKSSKDVLKNVDK